MWPFRKKALEDNGALKVTYDFLVSLETWKAISIEFMLYHREYNFNTWESLFPGWDDGSVGKSTCCTSQERVQILRTYIKSQGWAWVGSGVCWPLAQLQVLWETLSPGRRTASDRAVHQCCPGVLAWTHRYIWPPYIHTCRHVHTYLQNCRRKRKVLFTVFLAFMLKPCSRGWLIPFQSRLILLYSPFTSPLPFLQR